MTRPNNWEDDSVEIYLDLNNSKAPTYDNDDFQVNMPRDAGALMALASVLNLGPITVARTRERCWLRAQSDTAWSALNGAARSWARPSLFDRAQRR